MAARKGKNLLEQALRIAQASERSPVSRLTGLLRLATRSLQVSSATIYLPNPTHDALTRRFSTLLPLSSRSCQIPFGAGCAGLCALSPSPATVGIDGLHRDEPFSPEDRHVTAVALREGTRLIAVISLPPDSPERVAEIHDTLREIHPAFRITVAFLSEAERTASSRRNLALLASVGKLLHGKEALDPLLPKLLKACTASGIAGCAMIRVAEEPEGKAKVFKSVTRESQPHLSALAAVEATLSARALSAGDTLREEVGAGSCRHALCTPLGGNGRSLGCMTFFGGCELVSAEQIELAETVARLLSSALAEAISLQRISRFATENEKKLKELSLLYRMSNTMLSTIKLNKLIHLTLTALTSGPAPFFDRAMLFLVNERSGVLLGMLGVTRESSPQLSIPHGGGEDILSSRWEITEEEMAAQRKSEFCRQVLGKRLELDPSLNIPSQAVLEKRLIYIPYDREYGDPLPGGGSAIAASPLIAHGQAVGAVLVDNALTRAAMTQEELRFLQLFTNQAGMAIENSMLYNKIEDANRQLGEAQENLLQKERLAAIGEMAAGIAHELKGPLVAIGGFAGRLTRKLPQDSNEWGHADLIVREVLRLEGILSEILLFSKKTTICYTRCNIAEIVKDSLAVVTPPLEEKQISVTTKFPRQKMVLLGDGQQLKQVFINILLNAHDAMGEGGKLFIQISAGELDGKEAVCVKIADTGGGIPLEALNSIFTPFYTTKESGTGLGLPIANRIITNHGGKIQITNNPGQGVEFRVILPKHW
jgi:two-component system, NtrC family, sensor histidine kinase HydH